MQRWDIFCRVVDNFGDIGICWRLAKQLAHEHHQHVRLWVDNLDTTRKLIPALNPTLANQFMEDIEICHWSEPFSHADVADIVIEAFACELPESYLSAMAKHNPVWLNLEYLSAEKWVEDFHVQPSPHPFLPLTKHFFFPGFTSRTGGLIREKDLISKRNAFQSSDENLREFWRHMGIQPDESLKVSLFCYSHAPIEDLLLSVSESNQPITIVVPESPILENICHFFQLDTVRIGDQLQKGSLTVKILPFLSQDEFDRLLWASDINFVRGEDSWIRALWAGRPMVWLPYHQPENTHLIKVSAFLDLYLPGLSRDSAAALRSIYNHWCGNNMPVSSWQHLLSHLPELKSHAIGQSNSFAQQPDLASSLMMFCKDFFEK